MGSGERRFLWGRGAWRRSMSVCECACVQGVVARMLVASAYLRACVCIVAWSQCSVLHLQDVQVSAGWVCTFGLCRSSPCLRHWGLVYICVSVHGSFCFWRVNSWSNC